MLKCMRFLRMTCMKLVCFITLQKMMAIGFLIIMIRYTQLEVVQMVLFGRMEDKIKIVGLGLTQCTT